jgi:hypothetical protein
MKNLKFIYTKNTLFLVMILMMSVSCERDLSDEVEFATLGNTAEVFTDSPIGLGTDFYFPFLGSKLTAWTVDDNEGYESQSSMRIDVPNANDPEGSYAGAIFRVDGAGRDLTEYDALTFWAKASQGVNIGELGFGQDFLENKYQVTIQNTSFGTNWTKYIIPIPDSSKLFEERGMFWYSAGTQETGGFGYTFWIDDLKFEKLGTLGVPRPNIGEDRTVQTFIGNENSIGSGSVVFNLPNGINQTVIPAPSYFDWISSEPSIAAVRDFGVLDMISTGTSVITASLAGELATGEVTIEVLGEFNFAPTPTRDPTDVISIFSDVYTNVPVDFYNGFWAPFQTTLSADFAINGDNILSYTDFNFVGNQFQNPAIDATVNSNLHINMFIPGVIPSNLDFLISIVNFDGGGTENDRQQVFFNTSDFVVDTWSTLEIPITMANKDNIGLLIYENVNGSSLTDFYLDNIYFY